MEGPQGANMLEFAGRCVSRFQGDAGVELLKDNLSGDKIAFARDRFTERAQNGQSVSMRS